MQNTVTHYRVDQMSWQERTKLSNMGLNVMPGGSVTINECRPNGETITAVYHYPLNPQDYQPSVANALPSYATSFGYNNVGNSDPAIKQEENAQPSLSLQQPQVTHFSNILEYPQNLVNTNPPPYPPQTASTAPLINTGIMSLTSRLQGRNIQNQLRILVTERDAISAERVGCAEEKHAIQNLRTKDPKNRDIPRRQAELKARNISLDSRTKEVNDKRKSLKELKALEPKKKKKTGANKENAKPKPRRQGVKESTNGSNAIPTSISGTVQPLRDQKEKTGANCLPLPPAEQMTSWKRVLEAQNRRGQEKQAGLQESCLVSSLGPLPTVKREEQGEYQITRKRTLAELDADDHEEGEIFDEPDNDVNDEFFSLLHPDRKKLRLTTTTNVRIDPLAFRAAEPQTAGWRDFDLEDQMSWIAPTMSTVENKSRNAFFFESTILAGQTLSSGAQEIHLITEESRDGAFFFECEADFESLPLEEKSSDWKKILMESNETRNTVRNVENTDTGAESHLEKAVTKQTCTSLHLEQEIPSNSPIIQVEEQSQDVVDSYDVPEDIASAICENANVKEEDVGELICEILQSLQEQLDKPRN